MARNIGLFVKRKLSARNLLTWAFGVTTLIFFMTLSLQSQAATLYTPWTKIESIRTNATGVIDIRTVDVMNSSCANSGKFFRVKIGEHSVNENGQKSMLSALLSAYALDYSIKAYIDTATVYCYTTLVDIKK